MPETRVKVYRTPAEMQADVAEAATHGWTVTEQRERTDGTMSVTFAEGSEWATSPTAKDYEAAMGEALRKDRRRAETEKLVNGVLTLIVLAVIAWWAFGQPTLEDMQTKSIGELMQGWRF